MRKSVICGRCKQLVEILDRRWSPHESKPGEACPLSNTIYTAPVIHKGGGTSRPKVELVGAKPAPCPICHVPNGGMELSFRVSGQKAGLN